MTSSLCTVPGIIVLSAASFWLTENVCASGDTTESSVGSETRSNPDPRIDALLDEVRSLRDEVQHLRAKTDEPWLTEHRADEVRALVQDVLADADTRASLLADGMTAGWDHGFFLASADGNFKLKVGGYLQYRYVLNSQDNSPVDDNRGGFENTRTRLKFAGHVGDPTWIYYILGDFSRDGGKFKLKDAYMGHAFDDSGWTVVAGQFKVPMLREELVSDVYQLPVSRSLVWSEFTAGRTQGAALDYRGDRVHFVAGYTDGHPATGGFNSPALARDTEYALTARVEVLLEGDWSQFKDLTSFPDERRAIMLGGAVHYQDGEYGTADDELEVLQWTIDVSAEFGGANIFAYVVGRHLDSTTVELDQYAFVVQGGYFLADDWEIFGRYEWADDDGLSAEDLSVVTVGVNRYFHQHQVKWSTDIGFGLDEVTTTWGDGFIGDGGDITGWRTDSAGSDGQVVIRSQLQFVV